MLDFYQFLSLASLALQVSQDCETNFKSRLARDARPLANPSDYILCEITPKTMVISFLEKSRLTTYLGKYLHIYTKYCICVNFSRIGKKNSDNKAKLLPQSYKKVGEFASSKFNFLFVNTFLCKLALKKL